MSKQANPTLIGAFVFGAVILATVTILLLAGDYLFRERSQYIMYFEGAAQGLQVGAPVVFLGVGVGTVKHIQIGLEDENKNFMVKVTVELDLHVVQTDTGEAKEELSIRQLVEQGLRAQLKVQSLLTGQRYIDLDFYPQKPAKFVDDDPKADEIPTIPTTVEELTGMLEKFPIADFLADLASISASAGKLLSAEETIAIPVRLEAILKNLESLTARLDSLGEPLLSEAEGSFAQLREAVVTIQSAMDKVGRAADQVEKFADDDSSMSSSITQAGKELANAAQALQQLAGNDSQVIQQLTTSLHEISRAARALRLLAQSLEQQPEALLRGKKTREEY